LRSCGGAAQKNTRSPSLSSMNDSAVSAYESHRT
jgi:hypothetical protein